MGCKGKGFNCPTCPKKSSCPEYSITYGGGVNSSAISFVTPLQVDNKERINKLKRNIRNLLDDNMDIPEHWIEEYNELIKKVK